MQVATRLRAMLRRALDVSVYMPSELELQPAVRTEGAAYGGRLGYGTPVGHPNVVGSSQVVRDAKGSAGMETPAQFFQHRREVIAENIARRCEEQGVSQNRLAQMMDVKPKDVWRWFHAQHAPSDRYLHRLEKVLDVPRGYFTAEHGEEHAA